MEGYKSVIPNVVPFRKETADYPDLFPKGSFLEVGYAVIRNVPHNAGEVTYSFALKPNEPLHFPSSVILQKGGHVLFNPISHFGDNSRLQNWVNENAGPLRQIAQNQAATLTVVGKINKGMMAVYYVIEDGEAYFDILSIGQRLAGYATLLPNSLCIMPVITNDASLVMNRDRGGLRMAALEKVPPGSHVIAVPVTVEHREDSDIPRLYCDAARMRFLAFTYEGS